MAKKNSFQIWLEYAAARTILTLTGALPFRTAMAAGIACGSLAFRLLRKLRRVGMRNLELAYPEKSEQERERILRGAFRNLGRVMATVSRFDRMSETEIRSLITYEFPEEFMSAYEATFESGRGRILLTAHMGNWELQAFSFPVFYEPLTFLARRMDNPRLEEMFSATRTRLGNKQIDKTNSAGAMLRILRGGGNIGILADVNSHPKEGVFVPFFGIPACTAAGVAMLALRANAVIVPIFGIWDDEKGRYFAHHEGIIDPVNTGDRKADIERTTAEFTAAIERVIRLYPEQWIWVHRRWKTRPPGEPSLY